MFGIPGDDLNPSSSESGDLPDVAGARRIFARARSPFTEHLPLHRFASILIHAATAAERFDARLNGEENDVPSRRCAAFLREDAASRLTRLAEHPSRALARVGPGSRAALVETATRCVERLRCTGARGSARVSVATQTSRRRRWRWRRRLNRTASLSESSNSDARPVSTRPNERRGDLRTDAIEDDEGRESPRGFVHARKRAVDFEASAADVAGARARIDEALAIMFMKAVPLRRTETPRICLPGTLVRAQRGANVGDVGAVSRVVDLFFAPRARLTREIVHLLAASPRRTDKWANSSSLLSVIRRKLTPCFATSPRTPPRGLDDAGAYARARGVAFVRSDFSSVRPPPNSTPRFKTRPARGRTNSITS